MSRSNTSYHDISKSNDHHDQNFAKLEEFMTVHSMLHAIQTVRKPRLIIGSIDIMYLPKYATVAYILTSISIYQIND